MVWGQIENVTGWLVKNVTLTWLPSSSQVLGDSLPCIIIHSYLFFWFYLWQSNVASLAQNVSFILRNLKTEP